MSSTISRSNPSRSLPRIRVPPPPSASRMAIEAAAFVDELFGTPERFGETYAALVVQTGRTLAERYGGTPPNLTRPAEPVHQDTKLLSWSIAKSVLHAAVGVLGDSGQLDPDAPAAVAEWSGADDP